MGFPRLNRTNSRMELLFHLGVLAQNRVGKDDGWSTILICILLSALARSSCGVKGEPRGHWATMGLVAMQSWAKAIRPRL
jgi:hypothetical protein